MSPSYRIVLSYHAERCVFVARVPELESCRAEGSTRAEALAGAEAEIEATLANVRDQGGTPRPPIDSDDAFNGQLSVQLSRHLHRELAFCARSEGVGIEQLLSEIVPVALAARSERRLDAGAGRSRGDNRDNRRRGGGQYFDIMEDRASFLEYVRQLDGGSGPGSGRRRRPSGAAGRDRDRSSGGKEGIGPRPPSGADDPDNSDAS